MDTLENLKTLFLRIMRNDMDHFGLVAAGEKLKIDFNQSAQFSHQKNQLKCAVLHEILKSPNLDDVERDKYKVILDTTIKLLHLKRACSRVFLALLWDACTEAKNTETMLSISKTFTPPLQPFSVVLIENVKETLSQ